MAGGDRRSYDTGASSEAQSNLHGVISRLESLINERDRQVKAVMSDFTADGVADQYHGAEQRWNRSASEVRSIIHMLKSTLEKNDGTAQNSVQQAKSAVDNIG